MMKIVPSFEFRRRARGALKPVLSIMLVVALIAVLPALISEAVIEMTHSNPSILLETMMNRLMQVMEKYGLAGVSDIGETSVNELALAVDLLGVYQIFFDEAMVFLKEKGVLLACLMLMVALLTPVLEMGMDKALLYALRRKEFTPAIALSGFRYFHKVLGLELLLGLLCLLWMLPGLAVLIASVWVPANLVEITMTIGYAAMIVPLIRAVYRFAMARFILADHPETGLFACIRRSREVMKGRKMELFCLELSFVGWSLLMMYAQMMLDSLGPVIGMTLGRFVSMLLTLYMACATAAFYQEYAVGPLPADPAEEIPQDDPDMP